MALTKLENYKYTVIKYERDIIQGHIIDKKVWFKTFLSECKMNMTISCKASEIDGLKTYIFKIQNVNIDNISIKYKVIGKLDNKKIRFVERLLIQNLKNMLKSINIKKGKNE